MDTVFERIDHFGTAALEKLKKGINELRAASLEQLARLEELHEASVEQLAQEVRSLREHALKASVARPAAAWPAPVVKLPEPGSFGAFLLEPVVPVQLEEGTLHVHRAVLCQVPYFAALLDGAWHDAEAPATKLPCSMAEFALLMQRLYTGEPLGTPVLPVDGLDSALRLAAAADMLLIEDLLPELPALLRASVASSEDIDAVREAAGELPRAVAELLRSLEGSTELAAARAADVVAAVRDPAAREALSSVLTAHRGCIEAGRVVSGAKQIMAHARDPEEVAWAVRLARDHLTPSAATAVFRAAPCRESHSCFGCVGVDPFAPCDEALCAAFGSHLLRCAEAGVMEEAFECGVDDGSTGQSMHLVYLTGSQQASMCVVRRRSRLLFDETSAATLASALRTSRREVGAMARRMAQMLPSQLTAILTPAVLLAIQACVEPVIEQLLTDPVSAARWASVDRLAALPAAPRRAACAALMQSVELLDPEIVGAVAREVAGAAQR